MTSGQKKSARPKKACSAGGRRGGEFQENAHP